MFRNANDLHELLKLPSANRNDLIDDLEEKFPYGKTIKALKAAAKNYFSLDNKHKNKRLLKHFALVCLILSYFINDKDNGQKIDHNLIAKAIKIELEAAAQLLAADERNEYNELFNSLVNAINSFSKLKGLSIQISRPPTGKTSSNKGVNNQISEAPAGVGASSSSSSFFSYFVPVTGKKIVGGLIPLTVGIIVMATAPFSGSMLAGEFLGTLFISLIGWGTAGAIDKSRKNKSVEAAARSPHPNLNRIASKGSHRDNNIDKTVTPANRTDSARLPAAQPAVISTVSATNSSGRKKKR